MSTVQEGQWEHPDDEGTEVEVETGTAVDLLDGTEVVGAIDRAQIDMQIATAKAHPRSITKSLQEAETLATLDQQTAESCFYVLPRGGKDIDGPSARLAEIMVYSWGNLRAEADIVDIGEKFVTAMGTCFDLEKNVAVRVRVKRRITDKRGNRYNDDLIGVTSNAAISIALRNAVFKVIPAALVNRIYWKARQASLGKGTMEEKRSRALTHFFALGVKDEQVFRLLGVEGQDDLGESELIRLRGIANAIKEGETTVEAVFDPDRSSEATKDLNEALRKKANGSAKKEDEEGAGQDDGVPFALDGELPSGKHEGKTWAWVLENDSEYALQVVSRGWILNEEGLKALAAEIKKRDRPAPTDAQIEKLEALYERAVERGEVTSDEMADLDLSISHRSPGVVEWIETLEERLGEEA